ncbi:hypothetical protein GCM10009830_02520 [Glycomyces endophyticus]|uniref:DUF4878 domain-containing protein n=1 Tax=Glycomyces endophyticus TaxID=480996 RepID=A0ABP4RW43_9ACTN
MGKGLFRRTIRRARTARPSGPASTTGKRYRVVPVDDPDTTAYADPPRKWPRVAAMAAAWAVVLGLGSWIAPAFAASGSEENQDPRDEAATDAEGAALRYLRYGSNEDPERAEDALCEDASPELSPSDLDAIRQSYADELGGITDIDLQTGDPVPSSEGISIAGTVSYIYQGRQRHEEFLVTVQEHDGTYCVSDAASVEETSEPSFEPSSDSSSTSEEVDPQTVATDFLRAVVMDRDPAFAETLQCESFTTITAQDLDEAIAEWVTVNGVTTGFLNDISPLENATGGFEAEIVLQGELNQETFTFEIEVQQGCVASLEGGDDLMDGTD